MKKFKIYLTIGCTAFVIGLAFLLYAPISNAVNGNKMKNVSSGFDEKVGNMYNDTDTEFIEKEIEEAVEQVKKQNPDTDYDEADAIDDYLKKKNVKPDGQHYNWEYIYKLHEDMEEYNQNLLDEGQYLLNDPFAYEQPSFDLVSYSVYDNVFGHINIPAIDLELPIYLGANQGNMSMGAAHLSYSSMPIGGESTNAVFAAHRGYIGKIFFDNIVFLNEGDDVYITNFWDKLHYKVVSTEIISPYEIDKCYIQDGRDLVTLLTCHPYGYSTNRYMVVCERVYDE